MNSFQMSQKWQVKMGSFEWIPTQKHLHGTHWFFCDKWDRGFARFVLDKAIDLRKSHDGEKKKDIIVVFFRDLKQKCFDAVADSLREQTWNGEEEQPRKKPKKSELRAAARDSHLPFIKLSLPAVEKDGVRFGPCTMKVLNEELGSWLVSSHRRTWSTSGRPSSPQHLAHPQSPSANPNSIYLRTKTTHLKMLIRICPVTQKIR